MNYHDGKWGDRAVDAIISLLTLVCVLIGSTDPLHMLFINWHEGIWLSEEMADIKKVFDSLKRWRTLKRYLTRLPDIVEKGTHSIRLISVCSWSEKDVFSPHSPLFSSNSEENYSSLLLFVIDKWVTGCMEAFAITTSM